MCAVFIKEKRRLAIRNAAQQWKDIMANLELLPTNGTKEDVSPESSPAHSPAQTNGLALEPSPEEPKCVSHDTRLMKQLVEIARFFFQS